MSDDLTDRIAKLERELAELKAELKAAQVKPPTTRELLDAAARKPWPKYDPTEGFRLPASAAAKMAAIVPDVKVEGFNAHAWGQTKMAERGGFGPPEKREPSVGRDAWPKPIPIEPPPGVKHIDRIAEHFAELDKVELNGDGGGCESVPAIAWFAWVAWFAWQGGGSSAIRRNSRNNR